MAKALITLDNISVSSILHNVSLSIEASEIVTLIGPNGAGKTTLVRTVLGLEQSHSGNIRRASDIRIGYMPQKLRLNTQMPLSVTGFLGLGDATPSAINDALSLTGVSHLAAHSIHDVSGGELQRILLARALLRQPDLLVLDEPAQGVDLSGQAALYELIGQLRDDLHCAVLMVSHDLHLVMANTDKVICLNKHICCHGSPDHVSSDPAFIDLFGDRYAQTLAVYHHHHDHDHDIHGDVVCNKDAS